jgi:hypothetical protein
MVGRSKSRRPPAEPCFELLFPCQHGQYRASVAQYRWQVGVASPFYEARHEFWVRLKPSEPRFTHYNGKSAMSS